MADPCAIASRVLPDGRELVLYPMLFGNTRLCLGWPEQGSYDIGYCYHDTLAAIRALYAWDGEGHPEGAYKIAGDDGPLVSQRGAP